MSILQSNSKTFYYDTDSTSETQAEQTGADTLATSANKRFEQDKLWDSLIDHKLIEWGRASKLPDEDGLIPPTNAAAQQAFEVATNMRNLGWPLPTGVILDGEGGIVFENRNDPSYQQLEIEDDGSMHLVTFEDCVFQSRYHVVAITGLNR